MLADIHPTVDTPKALKSFEQFRKLKGKQWKSKCSKNKQKRSSNNFSWSVGMEGDWYEVETCKGEENCI